MGQSQSSHIQEDTIAASPGKQLPENVRGRKSFEGKVPKSCPHGLRYSSISESSLPGFDDTEVDHSSVDFGAVHHEFPIMEHLEELAEVSESSSEESDSESEHEEIDMEERRLILEDAANIKKMATFFLHPEYPVEEGSDCKARCYFDRYGAPSRLSEDELLQADQIKKDAKELRKFARFFLHPELPVSSDGAVSGRNYFNRPSAPDTETLEESAERDQILDDVKALKRLALDFLLPQRPVVTEGSCFGRNYFERPSSFDAEDMSNEQRDSILADAKALKQAATWYMQPELPVEVDGASFGRNYFNRPSAPGTETPEESAERDQILADTKALKKLAKDYYHPESAIDTDGAVFGRSYFDRPSADEVESLEDAEARARILEDAKALKQTAVWFMQPELPVEVDGASFGRNYFNRPSAPGTETPEESAERDQILADAKALKKLAKDFYHPEAAVVCDNTACGRNYFSRPAAYVSDEDVEDWQKEQILADAKALKKLAYQYHHPEVPVATDGAVFGRNYFTRPSSDGYDEDAEETARILEDTKALKETASWYLCPELPIKTDGAAFGRNYFTRLSAPEQVSPEEAVERVQILKDATDLKAVAIEYLHPELPVKTTDGNACGRNYFDRPSSRVHDQFIHTYPPHEDDEYHQDEHVEHFGWDDEAHLLDEIRQTLVPVEQQQQQGLPKSEEGGNLSRSPSSVMLFTGDA